MSFSVPCTAAQLKSLMSPVAQDISFRFSPLPPLARALVLQIFHQIALLPAPAAPSTSSRQRMLDARGERASVIKENCLWVTRLQSMPGLESFRAFAQQENALSAAQCRYVQSHFCPSSFSSSVFLVLFPFLPSRVLKGKITCIRRRRLRGIGFRFTWILMNVWQFHVLFAMKTYRAQRGTSILIRRHEVRGGAASSAAFQFSVSAFARSSSRSRL